MNRDRENSDPGAAQKFVLGATIPAQAAGWYLLEPPIESEKEIIN
jgi:hypothetical protein